MVNTNSSFAMGRYRFENHKDTQAPYMKTFDTTPRSADNRRIWRAGLRLRRLVRTGRTRRHGTRDHRTTESRYRRRAQQSGIHKLLPDQAIDPIGSTHEDLGQYIRREVEKWAKVVKDTGARID